MKHLFVFDLDGTLLNTIADLASAANYALAKLGFAPHMEENYYQFVGNGIMKLFERALPEGSRTADNIQKMRALFVPYYNVHKMDKTQPYDGILPLLQELTRRHVKLAVASNKYQAATEQLISHYFAGIPFVSVYGQREGFPAKPDPLLVRQIMHEAQVNAEETLYVGDSDVDMQTAKNAGVDACAVLWGFRSEKELKACQPRFVAKKPADILQILH